MKPNLKILLSLLLLSSVCFAAFGQAKQQGSMSKEKEIVKAQLLSMYEFINKQDMTDSLTFNKLKEFYTDDFVMLPGKANPLSDKETILEG
jgi:hypothetical protein